MYRVSMDFTEVYADTCSSVSQAVRMGNFELCKELIEKGLPVDARDNRGWESLHVAASCGEVECLKLILQHDDVNIDRRTFEEESALLLASRAGNIECVQALCEAGANPNASTLESISPLHEASSKCVECAKLLLKHGGKIDSVTFTDDTPLHLAAEYGQKEVMECLLEHGADMTVQNEVGLTPLFITCHKNFPDCLQLLIDHAKKQGGQVEGLLFIHAYDKATPLYIAAQEGHYKCVQILLDHGDDPNILVPTQQQQDDAEFSSFIENVSKLTALQIAMVGKHTRCIEMLLSVTDLGQFDFNNKFYNITTSEQYHPVQLASKGSHKIMELLLSYEKFADMCSNGRWMNYLPDIIAGDLKPLVLLLKTNLTDIEANDVTMEVCCTLQGRRVFSDDNIEIALLLLRIGSVVHPHCMQNFPQRVQGAIIKRELGFIKRNVLVEGDRSNQFYLSSRWVHTHVQECEASFLVQMFNMYVAAGVGDSDKLHKNSRPYIWLCDQSHLNFSSSKRELADMNSLAHRCRRKIVLDQIVLGRYSPRFIRQLEIPVMLQNYLLHNEHDWSEEFIQSFVEVEEAERRLNDVLDELDPEHHIPRSVAQSLPLVRRI